MKVAYEKIVMHSPLAVLRNAGYSPFTDPQSGESSFVLKLTSEFYPRFHLYVHEKRDEVILSLHLDQKKASYGANHMHSGEYEGPIIEKEMRRIDGWVKFVESENEEVDERALGVNAKKEKKPWWKIW